MTFGRGCGARGARPYDHGPRGGTSVATVRPTNTGLPIEDFFGCRKFRLERDAR